MCEISSILLKYCARFWQISSKMFVIPRISSILINFQRRKRAATLYLDFWKLTRLLIETIIYSNLIFYMKFFPQLRIQQVILFPQSTIKH